MDIKNATDFNTVANNAMASVNSGDYQKSQDALNQSMSDLVYARVLDRIKRFTEMTQDEIASMYITTKKIEFKTPKELLGTELDNVVQMLTAAGYPVTTDEQFLYISYPTA